MSEELTEVLVKETNTLSVEQLQDMIHKLSSTEEGFDLKHEMSKLKAAIKANPSACNFLHPEDVGEMTAALKKITNKGILDALNPEVKPKKTKIDKIVVTQEDIDNMSVDDLLP